MKSVRFLLIFFVFVTAGCVSSNYPLLKKESSIILFPENTYYFARSSIYVTQLDQCGYLVIRETANNGYEFRIREDRREYLSGTHGLKVNKKYHARVDRARLNTGPFKGWHIMQSCSSDSRCHYYAVRRLDDGRVELAVPDCGDDGFSTIVETQMELNEAFTTLCKLPSDTKTFYPYGYLEKKWAKKREQERLKKNLNKGDL